MAWEQVAVMVAVLSPLVGAPLTVISMYLRAIREQHSNTMREMSSRIATMEASIRDLLQSNAGFEREYATKEEWVRESMLARQRLERLTELVTWIQSELENGQGLAVQLGRAAAAMMELASQLRGTGQEKLEVRSEK